VECIVVLGHPEYYARFGFVSARRLGLRCEYNAPDDAFMAPGLRKGALRDICGLVKHEPELLDVRDFHAGASIQHTLLVLKAMPDLRGTEVLGEKPKIRLY
jgi:hypothetical protein